MPMAHIECHDDEATIENTGLVVFRKAHSAETRAQIWQRIVRDHEDRAVVETRESNSIEDCAPGAITVARAHPALYKAVDPNRPLKGSFWSSIGSRNASLGVTRECEQQVLTRYKAVEYEGNTLASPAFGDVVCKPRDREELHFVRRVLEAQPAPPDELHASSASTGPPPGKPQGVDPEVKPRSLNSAFEASGNSGYAALVVVESSDGSESRPVKRDGGVLEKAGNAEAAEALVLEPERGDTSTDEGEEEDEDDEEDQGSKRPNRSELRCMPSWSFMRKPGGSRTWASMASSNPTEGSEVPRWQVTTRPRLTPVGSTSWCRAQRASRSLGWLKVSVTTRRGNYSPHAAQRGWWFGLGRHLGVCPQSVTTLSRPRMTIYARSKGPAEEES